MGRTIIYKLGEWQFRRELSKKVLYHPLAKTMAKQIELHLGISKLIIPQA